MEKVKLILDSVPWDNAFAYAISAVVVSQDVYNLIPLTYKCLALLSQRGFEYVITLKSLRLVDYSRYSWWVQCHHIKTDKNERDNKGMKTVIWDH